MQLGHLFHQGLSCDGEPYFPASCLEQEELT